MGARLINNPRRTKIGQNLSGPSHAIASQMRRYHRSIAVDLRSEHDLKVLLKVGHAILLPTCKSLA